jgi:hypothetical protein
MSQWEINQVDVGTFFTEVRRNLFGGTLTGDQVEGMENILGYRDQVWPAMPDEELCYLLATAKWETAHTMQPIKEYGSASYLQSKPYYPYYGRGLVQLTWLENYNKYGFDPARPDDALAWPGALHVAFDGMIKGKFTGKKLADYFRAGVRPTQSQMEEARRIINGTDKKVEIAALGFKFLDALNKARAAYVPTEPVPEEPEVEFPPIENPSPIVPENPPLPTPEEPSEDVVTITDENFNAWLIYALETDEDVQHAVRKVVAGGYNV